MIITQYYFSVTIVKFYLSSFHRPFIIFIPTTANFPLPVAVTRTATLFSHFVDSATNTRTRDSLSLVMLLLSLLLLGLKSTDIKTIVIHIDNGAVGEVDAIILVIDTGEEIAVLVEFAHKSVIRSGVEDAAQLRYRLIDVESWGSLDGDALRMMVLANLTKDVSLQLIGGTEGLEPGTAVVGTQRGQDMFRQLVGGIAITDTAIQQLGTELATKEPVEFLGGQVDVVIQYLIDEGIYLLESLFLG